MAKNASFWADFFIFSCIVCDCVSIFSKSTCQRWKFIMKQLFFWLQKPENGIEQCFLSNISDLGTWNNITFPSFPLQFPLQSYRGPYCPVSTFAILFRTLAIGVSVSNSIRFHVENRCWKLGARATGVFRSAVNCAEYGGNKKKEIRKT